MHTEQLFVKMALSAWGIQTGRAGVLLDSLSDEQILKEIAPNKNRGIYVIGHLVAYHDAMNDILGVGTRAHSELDEAFLKNPDKSGLAIPSISTMRQYWKDVHQKLDGALSQLTPEAWFKKHNAMTDEDFEKDSSRNKLSVLINRTNHAAYHLGQLQLLK